MIDEINRNIFEINKGNRFFIFYNQNILYIFDGFTCSYYMLPETFSITVNGKLVYESGIKNDLKILILLKNILEKKIITPKFSKIKTISNSFSNYKTFYKDRELFFLNVNSKEIFLNYFHRVSKRELFYNTYNNQCKICKFAHICLFDCKEEKDCTKRIINAQIIQDILNIKIGRLYIQKE